MMFSIDIFKKHFIPIWKELISMAKKEICTFVGIVVAMLMRYYL